MALTPNEVLAVLLRKGFVLQKSVKKVHELSEPNGREVVYVNRTNGEANSALIIDPSHSARREPLLDLPGVLSEDERYHNDDMTRFPTAKRKGQGESHYGVPYGFRSERALLTFIAEVFPSIQDSEPTPANVAPAVDEASTVNCEVSPNAQADELGVERLIESLGSAEDTRRRILSERVVREGQEYFKKDLLEAYGGRCAVSGCGIPAVLEAAHIIPYRGSHTNIVQNGVLLRCDIHALFDSLLLWIDPDDRRVVLHESILESEYAPLNGLILREPTAQRSCADERLLRHRLEAVTADNF